MVGISLSTVSICKNLNLSLRASPNRDQHKLQIPESVLVVIHTPEQEVLLLERADRPGFWQSVTGSKDSQDEDLRLTAIREVQEETGIDASQFPL